MRQKIIFIVMCACVFFTTQCDGGDNIEIATPKVPEEPEEIPGMSEYSHLDWANEVYERAE